MRIVHFLAVGLLVVGGQARGADQGITGLKLVIRARGSAKKVVFVSKDPAAPFPAIGSVDDPVSGTPGGATVDVVTPASVATLPIPGGAGWSVRDSTLDAYGFKNPLAPAGSSMVRSVTLRQGRVLKVTARDLPLPLTAPLGSVGVRITLGTTRSCARFDATSIVQDVAGSFAARNALGPVPASCSDSALGLAVCGNGVVESGEACDGGADAACPGHCAADCTCSPYCGNGALDAGEQCDGASFGTSAPACTNEPGLAQPACQTDCTCCALLACSASFFDIPCCPGFVCPQRIGPNQISFCRKACTVDGDCDAGDFCLFGQCRTPTCSSNDDCPGGLCLGVCCYDIPGFGFVCG